MTKKKLRKGLTSKVPYLLIAAGFVLLLLTAAVKGYDLYDDYLAGRRAHLLLEQVRGASPSAAPPSESAGEVTEDPDSQPGESSASSLSQEETYDTVGILTISKLGLELPILSECTSSLLKVSVCKYEGETQEKPERLVVAGHNYKTHFGKISRLTKGDEVYFTNSDGVTYGYTVSGVTEISMYDHEALEQGNWDITLFTCNFDGTRRILIRCQELPL